jgi:predicted RNA-binding Zn ribbon-like protein
VTAGEAQRLRLYSLAAGAELRKIRDLRTRLERIVRALITSRSPAADDLDALARDAADAARIARLRVTRPGLVRVIDADAAGVATVRLRIVEAALALLASDEMHRVSACPSCGWFFVDTSKNRSRRWCSMAMCGSSAKARAYYRRHRRRS